MDETPTNAPSAAGPYPRPMARPPLRRSITDRKILGVCGGTAHHLGIDPVVLRVAVAVSVLFGGLGLVLYLLGWAFIPEEGREDSVLPRNWVGALIAVIAIVVVLPLVSWIGPFSLFGDWGWALPILLIVGVIALAKRGDSGGHPPSASRPAIPTIPAEETTMSPSTTQGPPAGGGADAPYSDVDAYGTTPYYAGAYVGATTYPPSPQGNVGGSPAVHRPRSYLGGVTFSVALLWVGLAWSLNVMGWTSFTLVTVLGVALLVLAVGLLVGSIAGRARWLVALALPLSLVLWGAAAIPENWDPGAFVGSFTDGMGTTRFEPGQASAPVSDFSWGVGEASLDVADWNAAIAGDLTGAEEVAVSLGVGELTLRIPSSWTVVVDGRVGLGEVTVDGVGVAEGSDVTLIRTFPADSDAPTMTIAAEVGLGQLNLETYDAAALPLGPDASSGFQDADPTITEEN